MSPRTPSAGAFDQSAAGCLVCLLVGRGAEVRGGSLPTWAVSGGGALVFYVHIFLPADLESQLITLGRTVVPVMCEPDRQGRVWVSMGVRDLRQLTGWRPPPAKERKLTPFHAKGGEVRETGTGKVGECKNRIKAGHVATKGDCIGTAWAREPGS